jgi:hypothetical protein
MAGDLIMLAAAKVPPEQLMRSRLDTRMKFFVTLPLRRLAIQDVWKR